MTAAIDHQNVLTQWQVQTSNPDVVNTATQDDLLRENHPESNHNGGTIAFGPDGDLYLSIGDGGNANDTGSGHIASTGNAQSLSVIYGKILRINPNGNNSANGKYGIPADNPFVNTPGALPEIYAYGLRNPYRFSFGPAGQLIVGDVGQNEVEEVDSITAGGNYGWPVKEGTFLFNRTTGLDATPSSPGSPAGLIDPLLEYDHNAGNAVIGGFVYEGSAIPALDGMYVFGDLSNGSSGPDGRLFYSNLSSGQINEFQMSTPLGMYLKGFGEDASGDIYVMASADEGPTGSSGVVMEITAVPEPATAGLAMATLVALATRRRRYAPAPRRRRRSRAAEVTLASNATTVGSGTWVSNTPDWEVKVIPAGRLKPSESARLKLAPSPAPPLA